VYPALSVVETVIREERLEIRDSREASNLQSPILWIDSLGGMEENLVRRAGIPFQALHGGGVHGVGWQLPRNVWRLARGWFEAMGFVRAYQPNVVFVTGGYVTAPVALAAWLNQVPVLMYAPDIEPGLALKAIRWLARKIAVTVEDSRRYFDPQKVVVTGYPTRPELAGAAREEAVRFFGLDVQRPTVLVTGGSRGARSINRAVLAALPGWLNDYQVIHLSGQLDWAEVEQAREALPVELRTRYHAFPYLHEMGLALAAADLVVSRAGASALGEYPLFGLPAILAPYPHAWRYQQVNADYLVRRGAAIRINDEDLQEQLDAEVRALLADGARFARMQAAARAAAAPGAAKKIARELIALAAPGRGREVEDPRQGADDRA